MDSVNTEITLPQQLHLESIEEFYSSLPKQLSNTVEIDGSNVSKIDTSGIQLLLALKKELNQASGTFHWKAISDPLAFAINTVGLNQELAVENPIK